MTDDELKVTEWETLRDMFNQTISTVGIISKKTFLYKDAELKNLRSKIGSDTGDPFFNQILKSERDSALEENKRLNKIIKDLDGMGTGAMEYVMELLKENKQLREEQEVQKSIDQYMAKRYDEITAVKDKHWESYWNELGNNQKLKDENKRLLEALEWACMEIERMYSIVEDGTEDYKFIDWNLKRLKDEIQFRAKGE